LPNSVIVKGEKWVRYITGARCEEMLVKNFKGRDFLGDLDVDKGTVMR
jgi:hypothetical protein